MPSVPVTAHSLGMYRSSWICVWYKNKHIDRPFALGPRLLSCAVSSSSQPGKVCAGKLSSAWTSLCYNAGVLHCNFWLSPGAFQEPAWARAPYGMPGCAHASLESKNLIGKPWPFCASCPLNAGECPRHIWFTGTDSATGHGSPQPFGS